MFQRMKKFSVSLTCLVLISLCSAKKKNVLFLVSDDMRPQLGAYYGGDFPSPIHPKMYTPNLDKLAYKSLLLRRAHTHYAVCSPSRTSLLTGRRPDTTHVYTHSHYFREVGGNFTTIPQYFKEHGYQSIGMGKIFHRGWKPSHHDDPISWSEPYWHAPAEDKHAFWIDYGWQHSWSAIPDDMIKKHGPLADTQIADKAIQTIKRFAPGSTNSSKPFFLAVGFHKPHMPFMFPEKYLNFYPEDSIRLPDNPKPPVGMPDVAWCNYMQMEMKGYADLKHYNLSGDINSTMPDKLVKQLRRAYYAATTYTDDMVGRVLQQLKESGLEDDTIVSFWGDHGWQLGEHGEWTKHTNFELSTHSPMMIHVPGVTDAGIHTEALSEFVDLFPTLAEVAGLPPVPLCPDISSHIRVCSEGVSMVPLMHNPQRPWKTGVFSQFRRNHGDVMGYTLRTKRFRYTEWPAFHKSPDYRPDWNTLYGVELYDHSSDPYENHNKAQDLHMRPIAEALKEFLHKGWRAAMPPPIYNNLL